MEDTDSSRPAGSAGSRGVMGREYMSNQECSTAPSRQCTGQRGAVGKCKELAENAGDSLEGQYEPAEPRP